MIPPPPRSTLFPYTTLFRSALRHIPPHAAEHHPQRERSMHPWHHTTGQHSPQSYPSPTEDPPAPLQSRSEEHTSELQSRLHLVCRLLLEKKKNTNTVYHVQH